MKLTLILLAGISSVFAQQPPTSATVPTAPASALSRGVMKRFQKVDKDGDGRIGLNEFKAVGKDPAKREKRFNRLDANHDGYLSPDEFAAGVKAPSR